MLNTEHKKLITVVRRIKDRNNKHSARVIRKYILCQTILLLSCAAKANTNSEQLAQTPAPPVAVASSLRYSWPALMDAYSAGGSIRVTFGSSGNLARQIIQGAPFGLLLSADKAFVDQVKAAGRSYGQIKPYAIGSLSWVAPKNSKLADWLQRTNVETPFPSSVATLSIANPRHAPYGKAAKSVLNTFNQERIQSIKLTLGENAAQALQFAISGATDGGIVPTALLSNDVLSNLPNLVTRAVEPHRYEPVEHVMVLVGKPTKAMEILFDFLQSDTAKNVLAQHGFNSKENANDAANQTKGNSR